MSATSLDALLDDVSGKTADAEYDAKMYHAVPDGPVVDRVKFLVEQVKDKIILDVGAASGTLHDWLVTSAKHVYSLDKTPKSATDYLCFDLELCHEKPIPVIAGIEVIVCGEVIEHLSNPGHALRALRAAYPTAPLIVTAPNAFCDAMVKSLKRDARENVNLDHVAYYSYWTLRGLLERHGYTVTGIAWYNGRPLFSEGIIMVATP